MSFKQEECGIPRPEHDIAMHDAPKLSFPLLPPNSLSFRKRRHGTRFLEDIQ